MNVYFLQKQLETTIKECKALFEANVKLLNDIAGEESYDARTKTELDKLKRVKQMKMID